MHLFYKIQYYQTFLYIFVLHFIILLQSRGCQFLDALHLYIKFYIMHVWIFLTCYINKTYKSILKIVFSCIYIIKYLASLFGRQRSVIGRQIVAR